MNIVPRFLFMESIEEHFLSASQIANYTHTDEEFE